MAHIRLGQTAGVPEPVAPDARALAGGATRVDLRAALRLEVAAFRQAERRRVFPPSVQVGVPAAGRIGVAVELPRSRPADAGLRRDLVCGLLDRHAATTPSGTTYAWVTRPGSQEVHDEDLSWLAAARWAFGAKGTACGGFWSLTRSGWLDVVTGESRSWRRLRL